MLDASGLLALGQALLDAAPLSGHPSLHGPLRRLRQACDDLQGSTAAGARGPAATSSPRPESRQPPTSLSITRGQPSTTGCAPTPCCPSRRCPRSARPRAPAPALSRCAGLSASALRGRVDRERSPPALCREAELAPRPRCHRRTEFLAEVRRTHEIYSRAIGRRSGRLPAVIASVRRHQPQERPHATTARTRDKDKDKDRDKDKDTRDSGENPALRDLRLHLARCISAYAVKVLALTPDDVKDYQATKALAGTAVGLPALREPQACRPGPRGRPIDGGAGTSACTFPGRCPGRCPGRGTTNSQGHTALRSPSPPSLHDWASNLRANDSSGDNKAGRRLQPIRPSGGGGRAGAPATPASDSRAGGQSGTYRPVGESGLYRPIKRPGSWVRLGRGALFRRRAGATCYAQP